MTAGYSHVRNFLTSSHLNDSWMNSSCGIHHHASQSLPCSSINDLTNLAIVTLQPHHQHCFPNQPRSSPLSLHHSKHSLLAIALSTTKTPLQPPSLAVIVQPRRTLYPQASPLSLQQLPLDVAIQNQQWWDTWCQKQHDTTTLQHNKVWKSEFRSKFKLLNFKVVKIWTTLESRSELNCVPKIVRIGIRISNSDKFGIRAHP